MNMEELINYTLGILPFFADKNKVQETREIVERNLNQLISNIQTEEDFKKVAGLLSQMKEIYLKDMEKFCDLDPIYKKFNFESYNKYCETFGKMQGLNQKMFELPPREHFMMQSHDMILFNLNSSSTKEELFSFAHCMNKFLDNSNTEEELDQFINIVNNCDTIAKNKGIDNISKACIKWYYNAKIKLYEVSKKNNTYTPDTFKKSISQYKGYNASTTEECSNMILEILSNPNYLNDLNDKVNYMINYSKSNADFELSAKIVKLCEKFSIEHNMLDMEAQCSIWSDKIIKLQNDLNQRNQLDRPNNVNKIIDYISKVVDKVNETGIIDDEHLEKPYHDCLSLYNALKNNGKQFFSDEQLRIFFNNLDDIMDNIKFKQGIIDDLASRSL